MVNKIYKIGAYVSLFMLIISSILYSRYAVIISFSCIGAYLGVFIRGKIDPLSWGKTSYQQRRSAIFGFFSIFFSISLISNFIIFNNDVFINKILSLLILDATILIIALVSYFKWFRKIELNNVNLHF